jgi:hypothetical protein
MIFSSTSRHHYSRHLLHLIANIPSLQKSENFTCEPPQKKLSFLKFNGISYFTPSNHLDVHEKISHCHARCFFVAVNVVFCETFETGVLLSLSIDFCRFMVVFCVREIRDF